MRSKRTSLHHGSLLFVVLLIIATASSAQPAQLGVSPSRFDIDLDEDDGTHSFRVFNYGDSPLLVNLQINNWELDEANKVRLLPPTEQSLDQWILINPVRFEVQPRESQLVRFAIRPRVKPEPGEHRAIIYLNQENVATNKQGVRFGFKVGMAVYATVGEVSRRGEVHAIAARSGGAEFDISSLGNANVRLSGQFALWPSDRYPGAEKQTRLEPAEGLELRVPEGALQAGHLPSSPVLPGDRRKISLPLTADLEPGEYILELDGALGDSPLTRTVRFVVTEDDATASTVAGGDRR